MCGEQNYGGALSNSCVHGHLSHVFPPPQNILTQAREVWFGSWPSVFCQLQCS